MSNVEAVLLAHCQLQCMPGALTESSPLIFTPILLPHKGIQLGGFFSPYQQPILWTPTGCPIIQFNDDAIYLELA